jgi:hypothetical protein
VSLAFISTITLPLIFVFIRSYYSGGAKCAP